MSGLPLSFQLPRKSAKSTHGRLLSDQMRLKFVSFFGIISLFTLAKYPVEKRKNKHRGRKGKKAYS